MFIVILFLSIVTTSIFSYYSAEGFDIKHVVIIPFFLSLIYLNIVNSYKNYKKAIFYLFAISTLFQIYLGVGFYGTKWDLNSNLNWAKIIDSGLNPFTYKEGTLKLDYYQSYKYDRPNHTPFVPLSAYFIYKLSQMTKIPFDMLFQLPSIISTFAIGLLLFSFMRYKKKKDNEIYKILALYLYNPMTLMISGYHGIFDNFSIVFLVIYYIYLEKNSTVNPLSHLVYGISIVVKQVTIFPLVYFLIKQKKFLQKVIFVLFSTVPFLLLVFYFGNFSFGDAIKGVLTGSGQKSIFSYSGVWHLWSYSRVEAHLTTSIFKLPKIHGFFMKVYPLMVVLMFFIMLIYFYRNKNIGYLDGIILSYLFFYVMSPGFGVQYLIWILPFAVLKPNNFYYIYSAIGSLLALFFYYGDYNDYPFIREVLGFSIVGEILWVVIVVWFIWYLRKIKGFGKATTLD